MTVATWWTAQQSLQASEGSRFFGSQAGMVSGSFGGQCFRAICQNGGATWYHKTAARYYCESCANDANLTARLKGEPAVCSKHI